MYKELVVSIIIIIVIFSGDFILQKYTNYLKDYCNEVFCTLNKIEWQFDSYLSLLTSGCELEDISIKGAKYNHYGVNSVGLASVVNSIINIKKFVFDEQKYTLEELNNARKNNFNERNDIVDVLKNTENMSP